MRRMTIRAAGIAALLSLATALTPLAPAQAQPPQCGEGPIVMDGCTAPGMCTAVIDNRCVAQAPGLLPPPPPVRVGIEGGVGAGTG